MRMMIVLNRDGGTIRGMNPGEFGDFIRKAMSGDSGDWPVRLVGGGQLLEALDEMTSDPAINGVIAGGGDGTISAAATACFTSGKILGVIPLGTMNLFARSLGLPTDPHDAVRALQRASPHPLDIATANGRPFIHQYSIGLHERLVSLRSSLDTSTRLRKIAATVRALGKVILDPPRFEVETRLGDTKRQVLVSAVSVSNNLFGDSPVPFAPVLDAGVLGLYHAKAISSAKVFGMTLDAARGALMANPYVDVETASRVVLRFPKSKRRARAAIDGEIIKLEPEIEFLCHAGALQVLVPSMTAAAPPGQS